MAAQPRPTTPFERLEARALLALSVFESDASWKATAVDPGSGWGTSTFDDSAFVAASQAGTVTVDGNQLNTIWTTAADESVWFRKTVSLDGRPATAGEIEYLADAEGDVLTTSLAVTLGSATYTRSAEIGDGAYAARDVDLFRLELVADAKITAEVFARRLTPASNLDSYLRIFNAAGQPLASNDDAAGVSDSCISQYIVPSTGTYYVGVSDYGNRSYDPTVTTGRSSSRTGRYELHVTVVTPAIDVSAGQTVTDSVVRDGAYKLVKSGAGTLILDKPNTHTGGTVVEAGRIVVKTASALGTGQVQVKAGAILVVDRAAGEAEAGSLVVADGGFVDLGTGRMRIVSGATGPAIVTQILAAQGDGSWTATTGFGSSAVANAAAQGLQRRIGWLDNGDGSFTMAFAAPGDSNLDGSVDILDVSDFVGGGTFNTGTDASWSNGNFTYDGVCDILDLADFIAVGLFNTGDYLAGGSTSAGATAPSHQAAVATTDTATTSWTEAAFASLAAEQQQPRTARKKIFASLG